MAVFSKLYLVTWQSTSHNMWLEGANPSLPTYHARSQDRILQFFNSVVACDIFHNLETLYHFDYLIQALSWHTYLLHYAGPRAHLAPHIHCLCQLCQLRTVVCLLTPDATATFIHFFITARPNYCCSLFWPPSWVVGVPVSGPAFPNLDMSLAICWMCSTGSYSNRGSHPGFGQAVLSGSIFVTSATLPSAHRVFYSLLRGANSSCFCQTHSN